MYGIIFIQVIPRYTPRPIITQFKGDNLSRVKNSTSNLTFTQVLRTQTSKFDLQGWINLTVDVVFFVNHRDLKSIFRMGLLQVQEAFESEEEIDETDAPSTEEDGSEESQGKDISISQYWRWLFLTVVIVKAIFQINEELIAFTKSSQ